MHGATIKIIYIYVVVFRNEARQLVVKSHCRRQWYSQLCRNIVNYVLWVNEFTYKRHKFKIMLKQSTVSPRFILKPDLLPSAPSFSYSLAQQPKCDLGRLFCGF